MNESQFSRELRKSLNRYGWFIKMVGGMYMAPGIPDILGCVKGHFVGIECKQIRHRPKYKSSFIWNNLFPQAQMDNLMAIEEAGGKGWGIINFTFFNPQIALTLTTCSIPHMNSLTLNELENMLKVDKHLILTRLKGEWDVEKLFTFL